MLLKLTGSIQLMVIQCYQSALLIQLPLLHPSAATVLLTTTQSWTAELDVCHLSGG